MEPNSQKPKVAKNDIEREIDNIPALMEGGYSCAEAVGSVLIHHGLQESQFPARAVLRPFRGGVASSKEEVCGALSGALMAVGLSLKDAADPVEETKAACSALKEEFVSTFGAIRCNHLIGDREGDAQSLFCRNMSKEAARIALSLINRN